jgi:hypothetical protein
MTQIDQQEAAASGTVAAPPPAKTKVTVNFAPDTYNVLAEIAEARNTSMAETLRRAIALLAFYEKIRKDGDDLMVRNHATQELDRIQLL